MKKLILILVVCIGAAIVLFLTARQSFRNVPSGIFSPLGSVKIEKPLDKYTILNLRKRGGVPSGISYKDSYFYYYSDGKKISGVVNLPNRSNGRIVVLLHGSADKGEYFPGFGTQKVAAVLAKNGYTTYAPDFLGYGESDPSSKDEFENRFQTYTATLDLIASIEKVSANPSSAPSERAEPTANLFLWGHSNGGQIALTILAITKEPIPTVLWNPVTKPFPYNILYFTDGYPDEGRWLRGATAKFEQDYDVDKYSFDKFLSSITAPILLQQGEADEWVPVRWSREFSKKISNITYKEYPSANHNLVLGWDRAVTDLLSFYNKQ